MEFLSEIILLGLFGGLVAVDTTSGWQMMLSLPIVACSLLGALMGHYELGLQMGILLTLPWLTQVPAGATATTEGNLGAIAATGIAIHLATMFPDSVNISIIFSILFGLIVGIAGGQIVRSMRRMNVKFVYQADRAAKKADYSQITLLNIAGVAQAYLIGFLLVGISFMLGTLIIARIISLIPPFFNQAFGYGKIGLIALGTAMMIRLILIKDNSHYYIIGLLVAVFGYLIF